MSPRVIRLRYAGTCAGCGQALPAGTRAWWDADARSTTCKACTDQASAAPSTENLEVGNVAVENVGAESTPEAGVSRAAGMAGGSARNKYERLHQAREERIDRQWGRLSGFVKFLSDDPQSTRAWARGSEGERRLAAHLLRTVGDRSVLLHDRKVPRTRGNIDHLAVAASGVWVIDAKNYTGLVQRRDKGGFFKTDYHLYVGGRDRIKIVDGLGWQIEAVRSALGDAEVSVHAALCFIEADWSFFAKPFQLDGVWVTWAQKLAEMIAAPGPLTLEKVTDVADRLAKALPPAVAAT
jgi:hypothetical protein